MAKIIGLTGGIGSGKTSIMKHIETLGYKVYYADDAGKKVMQQKEIVEQIVSLLGKDVLDENQDLNRKAIAEIVFSNPEKLKALNEIVHPAVAKDFDNFLKDLEENELVIKESAILFESKANENCDLVILITAPEDIRIQRVMARDNSSFEEVKKRIDNQMSDNIKEKKSDYVINNLTLSDSFKEIAKILKKNKTFCC